VARLRITKSGARWVRDVDPFIFAFQQGLRALAIDRRLKQQELRVLLFVLSVVQWDNVITIAQTSIGAELGMTRQNVHAVIERLVAYGILLRGEKIGNVATYRLHDAFAYRGDLSHRHRRRCNDEARRQLQRLSKKAQSAAAFDVVRELALMTAQEQDESAAQDCSC
jgi:DNA-binding IclR family transcriptional regulator